MHVLNFKSAGRRLVLCRLPPQEQEELTHNIIVVARGFINGTVGDNEDYKQVFLRYLAQNDGVGSDRLREHLATFLKEVYPIDLEAGVNLCILHPDDPPFPRLGLLCIASTIEDYFKLPNYYRIDGKPVFSIYETSTFIREMDGEEQAIAALDRFRKKCIEAGLPGVYIQPILPATSTGLAGDTSVSQQNTVRRFGFESLTNYQWYHFASVDRDYQQWGEMAMDCYEKFGWEFDISYFRHVSIGWDPNPRYLEEVQSCVTGSTPVRFETFLRHAIAYVDAHPDQPPLITINVWNEWAEDSCLEPDSLNGSGYLEAVKRVFKTVQR